MTLYPIIALLLVASAHRASPVPVGPLTIGSWNLEWFGTPERRRGLQRTPEDVEDIAQTIVVALRMDVVVLQEIATDSPQWRQLRAALARHGYAALEGQSGDRQRIVVAWNTRVAQLLSPPGRVEAATANTDFELGRRCRARGLRRPLTATFRAGRFDFTVVGLHLKGPIRPRGCHDPHTNAKIRQRQIEELLADLRQQRRDGTVDDDVIIVGDLNGQMTDRGVRALIRAGYSVLTAPTLRSHESGRVSYRKSVAQALDHVAISAHTSFEAIAASTAYHRALSEGSRATYRRFRRRFSDHAPVWSRFSTAGPDDD